jgi:hypothetical protein
MNEFKAYILSVLVERGEPVSWYQLNRRLSMTAFTPYRRYLISVLEELENEMKVSLTTDENGMTWARINSL